jgi:hypothetical protein
VGRTDALLLALLVAVSAVTALEIMAGAAVVLLLLLG